MAVFWFALTAAAVLIAQGALFKRLVMRKLGYRRHFKQAACYQGDEIELVEVIANDKWLPVPWLRAESQLDSSLRFRQADNFAVSSGQIYQNHRSFFSMAPFTRITRTHKLTALKRGWYKLNTVTLTGGDLLGAHRLSLQIPLEGELIVYPRPADVSISELASHSWQGNQSVKRFIVHDPFVIAGTRDYAPGDSYRSVNWKATARTGKLQVYQYDYTADRRLMIYLNVEDGEGMWRSVTNEPLIESGIELAAGAAAAAVREGMEAGFSANMPMHGRTGSVCLEPGGGGEHLLAMLETMAKLQLERTETFGELLERALQSGFSGRDVLLLSSYWNEELEFQANRLRGRGNSVSLMLLTESVSDGRAGGEGGRSA